VPEKEITKIVLNIPTHILRDIGLQWQQHATIPKWEKCWHPPAGSGKEKSDEESDELFAQLQKQLDSTLGLKWEKFDGALKDKIFDEDFEIVNADLVNALRTGHEICLMWKEAGSEKPPTGTEIENEKLAEALKDKVVVQFTNDQWDSFMIPHHSYNSFVKAGGRYYKPTAGGAYKGFTKEKFEKLHVSNLSRYSYIVVDKDFWRPSFVLDLEEAHSNKYHDSQESQFYIKHTKSVEFYKLKFSWNQQKFEEALAKLAQVASSKIKVNVPALDNDKSKRSRFSQLDVRVIQNGENITADFADKLSVLEISKLVKRMLGDMKREAPYSNISDVWEVQPDDDNFPRLVDSLFKQMARSDADRTKKHEDARQRRKKVKVIDEARKREEQEKARKRGKEAHKSCSKSDEDNDFKQSAKLLSTDRSRKWTVFDEDMFWIRELYDPCCKYEFRLLPETSMPTVGLEWEDMGTEKPKKCFTNKELSAALQKKDGSKFTKEEFAKFKASNLTSNSYIAVGDKYFKPSPAKMYVTTTDIFAFIWKKQLGSQWNQQKSLVSKKRGDDDQFVQACMERQYELKKAFVELLDSLKHFDDDGGGDHDNSKGGAQKSEPHTKVLRRHFIKAREDQMELDKNEFTKMCHDIGTSATFILNTDTLGNLSSHKLETLYNFVKAQEKELTVRFDVTFETHDEQEKKPELGGKKKKKPEQDESDRSRDIVRRMLKEILAKQKLKPQQIKDILASVKIDENGEGGEGEEEDEDTDEGNVDEEKDQHDQNADDDKVDDSPDGVQVHGGNYGEPERDEGGDEITHKRDEDEAAGVQARQVGGELDEVADKKDKNTPWSFGNLGVQEKFYAQAERFNNGIFRRKEANAEDESGQKPTVSIHLVVTFPITLLEKTIRRDVLTVENINKAVHEWCIQGKNGTYYKPGGKCTSVDVKIIKETSKPKNDADNAVLEGLGDDQNKQKEASREV